MKKQLLLVSLFFIACFSYGQIDFEQGYYITNDGQRVACFIKNQDWNITPSEFKYKTTENASTTTLGIADVQEFGIGDNIKYIRAEVGIDRSRKELTELSDERRPVFTTETLFLKVLIIGKASLYVYKDRILTRYFYNKEGEDISQLVHKYYVIQYNKIRENNSFQNQLWQQLPAKGYTPKSITRLSYKQDDLVRYFKAYNETTTETFTTYEKKAKKDWFNLTIRPGVTFYDLSFDNASTNEKDVAFNNNTKFRIGLEAEFILPFNKNKWAFIVETTYQHFKGEQEIGRRTVSLDVSIIELPIGIRYYMFLNNNSKFYVDAAYNINFPSNTSLDYNQGTDLTIGSVPNMAVSVGYKYRNRYSIAFQVQTNKDLLSDYTSWNTDCKPMSIIVGYSFL